MVDVSIRRGEPHYSKEVMISPKIIRVFDENVFLLQTFQQERNKPRQTINATF
jgi:hypothetical protein